MSAKQLLDALFDADRKVIEADVIEMLADLMNKRVLER